MERMGWVLFVVFGVALGVLGSYFAAPYLGYPRPADVAMMEAELKVKDETIRRFMSVPSPQNDELESLNAQLTEAKEQIATLENRELAAATAAEEAEPEDTAEPAEEPEGEGERERPTLDEIRERIAGNAQVNAQVKAITEMVYADFLNGVELEAAAKATLRELLVQSQIEEAALEGYAIRSGDVTGRELQEWRDAERTRLNGEVETLLSQENYEEFEQYQQTIDQRALEVTFESQIRAFSSGLTQENHDMVIQVAVEEFMIERNALLDSDEIYTSRDPFEFQITAMDNMRQRLEPVMAEDQFRELDNWLRMGDNVMRQALESQEEDE